MYFSLDRFEQDLAVLIDDNGNKHDIPRSQLPPDAGGGDIFQLIDGAYAFDNKETVRRRKKALELQKKLTEKGLL